MTRNLLAVLRRTKWVIDGRCGAAQVLGRHPNPLRSRLKKPGITRSSHEPSERPREFVTPGPHLLGSHSPAPARSRLNPFIRRNLRRSDFRGIPWAPAVQIRQGVFVVEDEASRGGPAMLRIARVDVDTSQGQSIPTLQLEGKLVGPWGDELSRASRPPSARRPTAEPRGAGLGSALPTRPRRRTARRSSLVSRPDHDGSESTRRIISVLMETLLIGSKYRARWLTSWSSCRLLASSPPLPSSGTEFYVVRRAKAGSFQRVQDPPGQLGRSGRKLSERR
jgi:hypothetical protein